MLKLLARMILGAKGWKTANNPPEQIKRCVLLASPHTSNWDYLYAISFGFVLGIRFRVAIKHFWTLFPFSLVVKPLGGIGIKRGKERDKSVSQIDLMADLFKEHKELTLVIAPEGTRKRRDVWKTGYYHMANMAMVPILPVYLDYDKRKLTFGQIVDSSKPKEDAIADVMSFYAGMEGKPFKPQNFTLDKRFLK